MKTKDQTLLEEAYKKVQESMRPNYFEDALANPKNYTVQLFTQETEDWDGNAEYHTIAYIYKVGVTGPNDYERIDNQSDVEDLTDAFKKHNPDGID
jgi:hypothetical protein